MRDFSPQARLFPLEPVDRSRHALRGSRWPGPTFGEFVTELEHEFGSSVDTTSLFLTGLDRRDTLSPAEVKALCAQLGVPAEDFGV
ncbi:MAG: hypothetical protein R3325_00840 [Thermoanaerobaculia bacterium]|nr:hypothetical protein [Thermoanaerobaculia bacterium]